MTPVTQRKSPEDLDPQRDPVERLDVALEVVRLQFCLVGTSVIANEGSKPVERVTVAAGLLLP